MLKKRVFVATLSIVMAFCMILPGFAQSAAVSIAEEPAIVISEGLEEVPAPLDPQSWQKQEDMTWYDYKENPVIDWATELNVDGIVNPKTADGKGTLKGALILVDFWDRPFIMTKPVHGDSLGYFMFDQETGIQNTFVTNNPLISVPEEMLAEWWESFLNDPYQGDNRGLSVDGYWRENSFGKWQVDLDAYGPYHLNGFEFEYGLDYTSWNDYPPTFRRGASGSSGRRNLGNESVAIARDNGIFLGDYDFFFVLHSGYEESNTWLEFGQMRWASPEDIPYEFGAGARMELVEEILTKDPELLLSLETTNTSYSNNTKVINGYNQNTVLRDTIEEIKARKEAGTLADFVFKFPQADWDWYENYSWGNAAPTRYVPWTSWLAGIGVWAGAGSATVPRSPENGGGSISKQWSHQGENNGMGTYAHEFGHIVSHNDAYENAWTATASPYTMYWELMAAGDRNGPGGYHARWTIPGGLEADGIPTNMMMHPKRRSGFYDQNNADPTKNDVLDVTVAQLKAGPPVVATIVPRNIPINNNKVEANDFKGYYPQLEQYGLVAPNFYKAVDLTFDAENPDIAPLINVGYSWTRFRAARVGFEVVEQAGYDSFSNDTGVLISRLGDGSSSTAGQRRALIDSHLYDINMVDYVVNGEPQKYVIGHSAQLMDGLFHVGKSFVDTGYYEGSIRQWEPQNDRPIVSGDSINEFYDHYNGLHFYILDKAVNNGRIINGEQQTFVSYTVGMLHEDGPAVGGELKISDSSLTTALPGNVAVLEFSVENTGDATDIVRVNAGGTTAFSTTLLNDLYALGAGEKITVQAYVEIPETVTEIGKSLVITASSETNDAKKAELVVENIADKATKLGLSLKLDKVYLDEGTYFNVATSVTKPLKSNVVVLDYAFDKSKIEYANYTLPAGVDFISYTPTETGARLTLMVQDYNMKDIVTTMFYAKVDLEETGSLIKAAGQFVVKGETEKEVIVLSSELGYWPPDPISVFNLIYLSNVIDAFGKNSKDADWPDYKRYDFNQDGRINIVDIVFVAINL